MWISFEFCNRKSFPYHLHPAEGPGAAITSVIFNMRNYDLWQTAVRMALKAKNKLRFIEGTLTKPEPKKGEDLSELNAWRWLAP